MKIIQEQERLDNERRKQDDEKRARSWSAAKQTDADRSRSTATPAANTTERPKPTRTTTDAQPQPTLAARHGYVVEDDSDDNRRGGGGKTADIEELKKLGHENSSFSLSPFLSLYLLRCGIALVFCSKNIQKRRGAKKQTLF